MSALGRVAWVGALTLGGLLAGRTAQAAEPTLSVGLFGALGGVDPTAGATTADPRAGAGAAVTGGLPLTRRVHLELALDGGLALDGTGGQRSVAGPWLGARPDLRLYLTEPQSTRGALSVEAGGGLLLAGGPALDLVGGLTFDLPGAADIVPRVSVLARTDAQGLSGGAVRIGFGFPRARPKPPPPPPPPDRWVWVPHPVRACQLESEVRRGLLADRGLPSLPVAPETPVDDVIVPPPLDLEALFRPTQGTLVVVAHPLDEVVLDETVVRANEDGTVVLTAPEGPTELTVRGAGRSRVLRPGIAAGYATWVRAEPDISSHLVVFELDHAELDDQDRAQLAALAGATAGWSYQLRGQYSPEGTPERNQRLAGDRALVVHQALLELGIPQDRLQILPIEDASGEGDIVRMRSCRVIPVPSLGAP
ncbi:MAG: hypothetical protein H6742_00375 [Alphaproteobacteria bacterium]|nr:hypothetical protein [Alphaproteobacteria bacterium]